MKAPKKNLITAALLAAPVFASALGLGGINVKSGLNQPLEAEIPVTVNSAAERESLSVMLANADDYVRVGLDATRLTVPIEFAVAKDSRGETIIRVTTKEAIREPFLQLLLQVNWNSGKLLREYSVLIDPPVMAPALRGSQVMSTPVREPAPVMSSEAMPVTKPAMQPKPVVTKPMAEPKPMAEAKPVTTAETKPMAQAKPATEPGTVNTKTGDSLYVIANANKPSASTSLDQMMMAILRLNPQAFYKDNVNALKKGQILRMPSANDVNKISMAEASKAIAEQNSLWRSYQVSSAQQSAIVADPGVSTSASTSASTPNSGARLELVPPKSGDNGKALSAANAETSRVREELVSREREASDLRARVTELEKLAADNERVVTLKNQELAQITKQLETARKTAAEQSETARKTAADLAAATAAAAASKPVPVAVAKPVETVPVVTKPVETKPIETKPVESVTAATTATDPAATTTATATGADSANTKPADAGDIWGDTPTATITPATTPANATPADPTTDTTSTTAPDMAAVEPDPDADPAAGTTVTPIDATPVAPTEEITEAPTTAPASETAMESSEPNLAPVVADKPWYMNPIAWGVAGAALLGGLALLFGRKKKTVLIKQPAPAFGDADVNFGIPGMAAAATDFVVHDEDEARIRAAIASDPQDLWAHLDLLRLYYSRQDAMNFEAAASTMFGFVLDQEAPQWQEARTMGLQLVPGSALFHMNSGVPDLSTAQAFTPVPAFIDTPYNNESAFNSSPTYHDEPLGSLDLGAFEDISTPHADSNATIVAKPFAEEAPSDFSFDLDLDSPTKVIAPVKEEFSPRVEIAKAEVPKQVEPPKDDFNFDFSFDAPVKTPELDIPSKAPPALNVGDISLGDVIPAPLDNLGDMGADDFMFGDDAVGTKLDLARAYLDMGDPDGARSMLEEVLGEGSDMQRNEAKELLQRIA